MDHVRRGSHNLDFYNILQSIMHCLDGVVDQRCGIQISDVSALGS